MVRRLMPDITPAARAGFEAELRLLAELEQRATLDKYVKVSEAYDAGMTVRDIGEVYAISADTATRWKDYGAIERARRAAPDPTA